MKVAVLGASGRAGSAIAKELAARGHEVLAIARHPEKIPSAEGITATVGDASNVERLADQIAGCDAVISALKFDVPPATLLAALKKAGVGRLLVTGGAASLKDDQGRRLIDTDAMPDSWKPIAQAGIDFFYELKEEQDVDWVFFSPAFNFIVGPRTRQFRLGGDQLIRDEAGESRISFADYAIAMADELESHAHSRERFTIAY
ncbi:NAD(P)-dependent oxidoreductase [Sphingobium nicotianae]|uniref:NAD(P)H-binding protein n=1 Tax=Sphingobium nicotianae TaxID=2782607 RepID=A0A9X1DAU7_9SPHN|nr:NAD(P)H-binding protein [Sphingobium nicotianae]MBT2186549.1 NAD(P)H-binding protein [Sphingobium nicotianae]